MMHSYMVYRGLQLSLAGHMYLTESWRGQDNLRVCCIGGGPGSDVVGLAKFLQDRTLIPLERLKCAIGDIYTEWEVDWIRISRANPYDFPFGVTYLHGNVTTINSCLTPVGLITIRSADIITMVKFYSTVAAFMRVNAAHGNLLREIFREMKPGALVLYIDNCYSDQHGEFRRLAQSGGVTECLFEWHGEMSLPIVGHSASISRVSRAIGVEPMQRCKVSLMLLRKPARQYPSRILGDRPYFQY